MYDYIKFAGIFQELLAHTRNGLLSAKKVCIYVSYQYINSSINLKVFTMCSPMVIHLYCNPVFILIWTKDEGRSEMASLPLQDFSNDNEDIRPSNRSSGLVNRCKRSKQDDTIQILFFDSNFNLVEEAHNAEVVLLDSTFQWWNIVFFMFRDVWGYGGSKEK